MVVHRSVEDQDMSLEQDYGITIDYGTPGPILEPHQDEYIGQEEDARKMESGQNLNREWEGLCPFTGRCKRSEEVYPCFINLSIQTSQEYKTALTSQC